MADKPDRTSTKVAGDDFPKKAQAEAGHSVTRNSGSADDAATLLAMPGLAEIDTDTSLSREGCGWITMPSNSSSRPGVDSRAGAALDMRAPCDRAAKSTA